MKILAIEREIPNTDFERIAPHLKAETLRVWELIQANILREIYREQDTFHHILIFECASVEEAKAHLQSLPLVKEGLSSFEIIPLTPYPGFERLFADS